ncbi:MAG: hypothetical protein IJO09_05190 [Oscillospiraceae bacterium]|nr:hypothetical protein [Oscillospiraceae bacterium]
MKKLLSLVLALSLIISVAPMSFAENVAGEEPVDEPGMYFNFNAEAFGSDTDIPSTDIIANGDSQSPVFASVNTDPWYIEGQRCINGYALTSATPDTTTYPQAKASALHWNVVRSYIGKSSNKAQAAFVIRLKINETGTFTPSVKLGTRKDATTYLFTLVPVSVVDRTYKFTASSGAATLGDVTITNNPPMTYAVAGTHQNGVTNLGTVACYSSSVGEKTVPFDNIEITETGDYYLYIAGTGRGSAANSSSVNYNMNLHYFHLTPVPAKDLADAAFTATADPDYVPSNSASIAAYALCGAETPESLSTPSVNYGETCELEAPLTKTVGETTYKFLYWARGLSASSFNKIVSCENNFTYRPAEGVNYLIAVYEEEAANTDKAEFYNGNGERMTDVALDDSGNLPELPYMAGYGEATGWKLHQPDGNGEVFAAGDAAPTEGTRIFVAQYDDPEENITITVNGEESTFAYGDVVTCRSDDANFSYWEKTINGKKEIVSINKTYTFNAWEDCTVDAVCNGTFDLGRAARKVLLGTFTVGSQTAVMAEFIGFGNVFEKGLVLDGNEITMQSKGNQFTITNDTDAAITVNGYAILDEEGETARYTDGNITVAGVSAE